MRTLISVFSILALTLALGCSDGSGDGGTDAAPPTFDAAALPPDAMLSSVDDGKACTVVSQEDLQGDCATSHACVGGTCYQRCDLGENGNPTRAVCSDYTGPGSSVCVLGLSTNGMAPFAAAACGVHCSDSTGTVPGCEGGACDGTCPGTWTCTADGAGAGIGLCG
ncbi:MAG: hypothetical protein GY811_23155 [Myxococcales bacterium]|nr:hypothetical protein [Myxococcales bacterium]